VPSPSAASILDERFGVVFDDRGAAKVRSETSAVVIDTFVPQERSWTFLSQTVSPDGRFVAYWAPVNDAPVLHVRSVGGVSDRRVFTGPPDMFGNAFAWASDGSGLAVAIDNGCQEICGAQGGRTVAELWTVTIASGTAEKIASGKFWIPVAWDHANNRVAAGVTGPGGYLTGYDVIDLGQRPYRVRGIEFDPTVIGRLKASSDARYVALAAATAASATLAWWPLAEPEKRIDMPLDGEVVEWRPGTSEIWWVGPACRASPCSGTELIALDANTLARRSLRGSFGATIAGFRVDGSAAMTLDRSGGSGSLIVVDVTTGETARLPEGGPFVRLR
jgi:hypothetical protein